MVLGMRSVLEMSIESATATPGRNTRGIPALLSLSVGIKVRKTEKEAGPQDRRIQPEAPEPE